MKNLLFCEMQNKDIRVPSTHGRFSLSPLHCVIRQDKPMGLTATEMKEALQEMYRKTRQFRQFK